MMKKGNQIFESVLTKRVSYIIASKGRPNFLRKVLIMVNKLKKASDEVIVINGSIDDKTSKIISRYKNVIDKSVKESDVSEGHAYNKGLLLSNGKYIKLLADDDIIYPESMEYAINILEANPDLDILLCGGIRRVKGREEFIYVPPGSDYGKRVDDVFRYGGCGIGLVIRRRVLSKVGIFNTSSVALDLDFITQCISRGANVKFCRIKLFYHPIEAHSGTVARYKEWQADKLRIQKKYGLDNNISSPVTDLFYIIKKKISGEKQKLEYIWDGGFS